MKFLIIGDLHGHKPKIHFTDFDAIIAPGDFCSDAPRKYMFKAMRTNHANPFAHVNWYDLAGKTKAAEMVKKSVADGRKILEFLNSFGVPVFIVPGNWDWTPSPKAEWAPYRIDYYSRLTKGLRNVVDIYHARAAFGDLEFIGHGITSGPEFPIHELENLSLKQIRAAKKAYEKVKKPVRDLFVKAKRGKRPVIFISHNVPYNTPLDKIVNKDSPRNGMHFGSYVARDLIDEFQPLVCVGGHMHEHFGKCKVGKTTAINAGFGSDVNVLLDVTDGRIRKIEFWNGSGKKK